MGTRKQREKQEGLWIAQLELAAAPGHPFYQELHELLEAERFDEFVVTFVRFYTSLVSLRMFMEVHKLRIKE